MRLPFCEDTINLFATPEEIEEARLEYECALMQSEMSRVAWLLAQSDGSAEFQIGGKSARDARERDSVIASMLLSLGFDVEYSGNPSGYTWDRRVVSIPKRG